MITKEVREWIEKVQRNQYSYEDAMYIFQSFLPYLTKEEVKQLQTKLNTCYKS